MLWRTEGVASQGLDEMDGVGAPVDFSSELGVKFQTAILLPLMSRAVVAPNEVHAFIELIRDKLDALASLLPAGTATAACGGHAASSGAAVALPAGGSALSVPASDADEIGRNQRSRVREMVLLETLESEHHALPLQQLTKALKGANFDDTSSAIVSQLHRLKKVGVIDQPANGMYAITEAGLVHLRLLRKNFGPLIRR